jgi:hypothetical protein
MASTEYGRKLGQAIRAIRKMHEETAQLLRDCDRELTLVGFKIIHGPYGWTIDSANAR